jgi:opacity protein-like surface antigen
MKYPTSLYTLAMLAGFACAPAHGQEVSDWYVAASGSLSLLKDSHTHVLNLPTPAGRAETVNQMSTGPGFQLAAGHRLGNARVEIEGGYSRNKSGRYVAIVPPTGSIASEGGHKAWRLMANGYYDFGDGPLKPYLGAGAGYASIKARLFSARPPFPTEPPLLILDDRKGEFAWQAMAGAAYELSPGVALTAQYRWLSAGKVHLRDLSGFEHVREHKGHNLDVGVRFNF